MLCSASFRTINAIILLSFSFQVSAVYFTNPPSFVNDTEAGKVQDLATSFTIGQTVVISWNVPASTVPFVSLTLSHWDVQEGIILKAFLSSYILPPDPLLPHF